MTTKTDKFIAAGIPVVLTAAAMATDKAAVPVLIKSVSTFSMAGLFAFAASEYIRKPRRFSLRRKRRPQNTGG